MKKKGVIVKINRDPERTFGFASVSGSGEGIFIPGSVIFGAKQINLDVGSDHLFEVVANERSNKENPWKAIKIINKPKERNNQ